MAPSSRVFLSVAVLGAVLLQDALCAAPDGRGSSQPAAPAAADVEDFAEEAATVYPEAQQVSGSSAQSGVQQQQHAASSRGDVSGAAAAEPPLYAQQAPPGSEDEEADDAADRERAEAERLQREQQGEQQEQQERESQQQHQQQRDDAVPEPEDEEAAEEQQQQQDPAGEQPEQQEDDAAAADEEAVASDPRLGPCTREELSALSQHFSDPSACPAYSCIDTETNNYLALVEQHYPDQYSQEEAAVLAGVLAACHCRCPVMRCEIEYIAKHGSDSCRAATRSFCLQSNTKFSDKCSQVAQQLPKVYDIDADPHAFKSPCQVCEPEDLPLTNINSISDSPTPSTVQAQAAQGSAAAALAPAGAALAAALIAAALF